MKRVLCLLLILLLLSGCAWQKPEQTDFWAMDTYMNVKLWGKDATKAMEQIKQMTTDIKGKQAAYRTQEEERRKSRNEFAL